MTLNGNHGNHHRGRSRGFSGFEQTPPNQTYLQTYNTNAFVASLLFTKNQQELGQICLSFDRAQP